MGMAQLSVRPKNENQFLRDQTLIVLNGTLTTSGTTSVRVVADGLTFVCVSMECSCAPTSAFRQLTQLSLNFPIGTRLFIQRFPIDIQTQSLGSGKWVTPVSLDVNGLRLVGDGVDDIAFESSTAGGVLVNFKLIGYEIAT